jgi:sulfite reductase alpha subunit-like flavoprotein
MRALIEERAKLDAKGTKVTYTVDAGDLLIFGNRNRVKDYLFEEEWARFRHSHDLAILTAFSRDGPPDEKKTYVQDVIARQGKQIFDRLIHQEGMLFISGSSGKMPQGVKEAVIEIIQTEKGVAKEEARHLQEALEREGRWKQETW